MRFESQTHPQDDHIDRITGCSTPYGQAPAVAVAWDWPREDGVEEHSKSCILCAGRQVRWDQQFLWKCEGNPIPKINHL